MASCWHPMMPTLLLIISFLILSPPPASGSGDRHFGWGPRAAPHSGRGCAGSVGECLEGGDSLDEFGMESEISRRILATTKYISYGALQRDRVPCSQRGASYYNCKPGATANPYSRGCSNIARCRS